MGVVIPFERKKPAEESDDPLPIEALISLAIIFLCACVIVCGAILFANP